MAIPSGSRLSPIRLNTRAGRALRSTTLSLTTGTLTPISFDVEEFDNASMITPGSAVVVLPVAGLWGFAGYGAVASNATGHRRLLVEVGSSGVYPTIDQRPAVSGDVTHMTLSGTYLAAAGDQLRLNVQQNSGSTLLLLAGAHFSVWLIES